MSTEIFESIEKKTKQKPNYAARRLAAAALLSATLFAGVKAGETVVDVAKNEFDKIKDPYTFSEETRPWVAQPGDGLFDAANHIDAKGGINNFDIRILSNEIKHMNEEALSDGLQAGEVLDIPATVTRK